MPMSARTVRAARRMAASGAGADMVAPLMTMRPADGCSRRAKQRRRVVLPDPEGPTTQITSRSMTGRVTFFRTWFAP